MIRSPTGESRAFASLRDRASSTPDAVRRLRDGSYKATGECGPTAPAVRKWSARARETLNQRQALEGVCAGQRPSESASHAPNGSPGSLMLPRSPVRAPPAPPGPNRRSCGACTWSGWLVCGSPDSMTDHQASTRPCISTRQRTPAGARGPLAIAVSGLVGSACCHPFATVNGPAMPPPLDLTKIRPGLTGEFARSRML
jgi:hypothetical protein